MTRRFSIAAKFFLTHLVTAGIALFIAGAVGFFLVRSLVMADADETLLAKAHIVAETFRPLLADSAPKGERIAREGDRLGREIGTRITVVLPDGTVVADSAVGATGVPGMENHAFHPEIRDALAGTTGVSLRRSITAREEQRYAALPIAIGGSIVGAARASVPAATLSRRLWQITGIIWGTGVIALLLILGGTAVMARRVTGPLTEMQAAAKEMGAGDLARRVQVRTGDELEEMANAMNRMASHLADTIGQLDAGKARLETLLANLDDGVIVIAADRSVRMMNREAGKIFDASETMGAGRPYPEVIRHPRTLAFIDGWMKGEEPKPRDLAVVTRQGSRAVRCSGTTVRYPGESDADILLTLRDVTEERRLSQIKSDFVSNASHELRTPLTNIRGYLEAIQDAVRDGAADRRPPRTVPGRVRRRAAGKGGHIPLLLPLPRRRPAPVFRETGGKNAGSRGGRRCVSGRPPEARSRPLEPGRQRPEIREGTGTRHPLRTDRGGYLPPGSGRRRSGNLPGASPSNLRAVLPRRQGAFEGARGDGPGPLHHEAYRRVARGDPPRGEPHRGWHAILHPDPGGLMKLYLVRHAEAIERSGTTPDASRYLTTKGRLAFRKIARRVRRAGIAPDVIFTSPLLRAVQTAEILAERLKHEGPVVVAKELSPGFDLPALRSLLAEAGNPREAAFVGHEPDLGTLAAILLDVPGGFPLRKGAVLALEADGSVRKGSAKFLRMEDGKPP
jgi:phosphohistidine phosphatase SixA